MGRGFAKPIPLKQHLAEQILGLRNRSYKEIYNLMSRQGYIWDKVTREWKLSK